MAISVTDPLTPTFQHIKHLLFKPFSFGRWFRLGWNAWLTILSESLFGWLALVLTIAFEVRLFTSLKPGKTPFADDIAWIQANQDLALGGAIGAVALLLVTGLGLLWIECRAQMAWVHNIVMNQTGVTG